MNEPREICLNSVPPDYLQDLVAVSLVLIVFALAGLIYTAIHVRRSVVGQRLLEVCAGDVEIATMVIENARADHELLSHPDPRIRRRWFTRGP